MKNLSRILTVLLCFAPVANASAAPVATTAGSNLTAFNPSNANNNQWATLSNGRYDSANAPTAKADFGNCNALILRCAQPKCSNGGCTEASVAAAIVKGCVQSNKTCAQYGDDLVQYMTAQLVASSNAKINEQQAAAASAAAEAAQQQSQQQMQQMQYQMQQMQAQMAQQQAESAQQLQEALAQQAAQNAAALESMKSAATDAAKETEAGITAYQQEAIDRGISTDVIERQKITGQIMTEIENAEVSLKEVRVAMNNAFEYAKCDARGNSCSGPKRVKKWRELARDFTDPYNNTIDKIYDALVVAQTVGVDLSQIYMMLDNSCNSWGQYMCPQRDKSRIVYTSATSGQKGKPYVCPDDLQVETICAAEAKNDAKQNGTNYDESYNKCVGDTIKSCTPCTMLKTLTSQDEVYEGWVNAENGTGTGNTTVVACASGVLDSAKFFAHRTRNKNGANLVDMEMLELWLDQIGSDKYHGYSEEPKPYDYCYCNNCSQSGSMKEILRKSTLSKTVNTSKMYCKSIDNGKCKIVSAEDADASYINPIYAICDAHQYNKGNNDTTITTREMTDKEKTDYCESNNIKEDAQRVCKELACDCRNKTIKVPDVSEMKEIIGLKITVISQQMYKQYEYLNATLRRLKTQLEKATLTATLEAAGAKSEDGSSSGGLAGGSGRDGDKEIVLPGAENCWNAGSSSAAYTCIQNNLNLIKSNASTNKKKAAQQLNKTVVVANQWGINAACAEFKKDKSGNNTSTCEKTLCSAYEGKSFSSSTNDITNCANALSIAVARKIDDEKKEANRYSRDRY